MEKLFTRRVRIVSVLISRLTNKVELLFTNIEDPREPYYYWENMANNPSDRQWQQLLDIVEENREMRTGQFTGPNGVIRVANYWKEAADELNAIGGAIKSGAQWKDAWGNLKARPRKAYNERMAYMKGTGGGPSPEVAGLGLSQVYTRTVQIIGVVSSAGLKGVPNPLDIRKQRVMGGELESSPPGRFNLDRDSDFSRGGPGQPSRTRFTPNKQEASGYVRSEERQHYRKESSPYQRPYQHKYSRSPYRRHDHADLPSPSTQRYEPSYKGRDECNIISPNKIDKGPLSGRSPYLAKRKPCSPREEHSKPYHRFTPRRQLRYDGELPRNRKDPTMKRDFDDIIILGDDTEDTVREDPVAAVLIPKVKEEPLTKTRGIEDMKNISSKLNAMHGTLETILETLVQSKVGEIVIGQESILEEIRKPKSGEIQDTLQAILLTLQESNKQFANYAQYFRSSIVDMENVVISDGYVLENAPEQQSGTEEAAK